MTNLIIGHTTHRSAKIWVRGDRSCPNLHVSLRAAGRNGPEQALRLRAEDDYTDCIEFDGLSPGTGYEVQASAEAYNGESSRLQSPGAVGRFRTAPEPNAGEQTTSPNAPAFTFLLGSCNLSSIRVANLLALVAGFAGLVATKKALLRTDHAPFRPPAIWRRALSFLARVVLKCVYERTAFRQPPPHPLVSPFLRLSALFGTRDVTFVEGQARPRIGAFVVGEQSRALGAVVFDAIVEKGAWATDEQPGNAEGHLSIVPLHAARFEQGERLLLDERDAGKRDANRVVGKLTKVDERAAQPPEFMLHVGDQIYFDFPRAGDPVPGSYRAAYREAWVEDRMAAYFLSQCPQYMTMDDHEIFNNFARDGRIAAGRTPSTDKPKPDKPDKSKPDKPKPEMRQYFEPAIRAYREYVHARHPKLDLEPDARCDDCGGPLGGAEALYYTFAFGDCAHFFVTDTRGERYERRGEMISCCQMAALKRWLKVHRDDLAFVVSSVPFVPHIYSTADEARIGEERGSSTVDKWCAPAFCRQRDEIARCIWQEKMSRVIFLTGDMHCCYYATMRVGEPSDAVTIHELCAGPIYQLTLADPRHFYEQYRGNIGPGKDALRYVSRMRQLYSAANAVMQIRVETPVPVPAGGHADVMQSFTQTVAWNVIATISEPRALRAEEAVVSGRIPLQWTKQERTRPVQREPT